MLSLDCDEPDADRLVQSIQDSGISRLVICNWNEYDDQCNVSNRNENWLWQKIWDGRIPTKFNETITFMYFMLRLLHGQLPSTAMFISFLFYSILFFVLFIYLFWYTYISAQKVVPIVIIWKRCYYNWWIYSEIQSRISNFDDCFEKSFKILWDFGFLSHSWTWKCKSVLNCS